MLSLVMGNLSSLACCILMRTSTMSSPPNSPLCLSLCSSMMPSRTASSLRRILHSWYILQLRTFASLHDGKRSATSYTPAIAAASLNKPMRPSRPAMAFPNAALQVKVLANAEIMSVRSTASPEEASSCQKI